jgi:uncharacterized protein (TIGR00255 family)
MTGYASATAEVDLYQLVWEIRSVNHRFLDVSFRLPEELRNLESRCKDAVGAVIRRGKVDANLKLTQSPDHRPAVRVRSEALEVLLELQDRVLERFPDAGPLTAGEVLRWPGLLAESVPAPENLAQTALDCLAEALRSLKQARQREGSRLAEVLMARCAGIRGIVAEIQPRLGEVEHRYRSKLLERIAKLDLELEPDRLEQEIALIAQRLDVTEELDRLASHVVEIEATLAKDEAIGRRLDFIIQELNREANTFASKVQNEELTRHGVELKVLIEQMREQVQNLE